MKRYINFLMEKEELSKSANPTKTIKKKKTSVVPTEAPTEVSTESPVPPTGGTPTGVTPTGVTPTGGTPTGGTPTGGTPPAPKTIPKFSDQFDFVDNLFIEFWKVAKKANIELKVSDLTPEQKVKYDELLKKWKEEQTKLGKTNLDPGEGTRKNMIKQAIA